MNGTRSAPVQVGEIYDVTIDSVGGKGDGIARVKGFVLFVPGTKQGDLVKIRITKVLEKVGFAEVAGKGEASQPRQQRFATISKEELAREEEPSEKYEDSENFGEEEK